MTMHAGKETKQSNIAIGGVISTSANAITDNIATTDVKRTAVSSSLSSCNIDCSADIIYYWDCKKVFWPNEIQNEIEWNQRYYCYHGQQQTIKKLHNRDDSKVSNSIREFDNCLQLDKYLLVKKNKQSVLISRFDVNNSSGSEEEENCCFSKQRIVYQSYHHHHHLKHTSTQQYNTASSSSSSSSSFIRSQNNHIRRHHHYRYQQQSRCILHANLKLFIYWHAFSLLACFAATGLSVRATVSKTLNSNNMKHMQDNAANVVLLEQSSKHLTSTSTNATSTNDSTTSIYSNPFLKHFRSTSMRLGLTLDSFCYVWSSMTSNDLCKLSPWPRYQFLRKISVFNRDCLEENNIKAAQLFRLIPRYINNEADLQVQAKFLRANIEGQACIIAPAGAQQCLSCFQKIDRGLKRVDKAYEKFNLTLHRFDCMLAVDTASATRPFSPNGSCTDCKIWYRKWLIMHSLNLWSVPPCINWCYYVQLACPHLATSKVVDYAGHPSFQCRDLHIPSIHRDPDLMKLTAGTSSASKKKSIIASKCACLHPCDLEEFYNPVDTTRTAEQNRPNSYLNVILKINDEEEDFFPSAQHCMIRRQLCGNINNEVEDHHVMRRSLITDAAAVEEKLDNFRSNGISSLSNFMITIASIFMRSPDSISALPHRQDSAIQKYFFDPIGYVSQWWTKHRARRRSQFDAKIVTSITTTDNIASTATPIVIDSAVVITPTTTTIIITSTSTTTTITTISSGVAWKGTKWITCSGISIYTLYTLFFSLLLLRRPLLL